MHKNVHFFAECKSKLNEKCWKSDLHSIESISIFIVFHWLRDWEEFVIFSHPVLAELIPWTIPGFSRGQKGSL